MTPFGSIQAHPDLATYVRDVGAIAFFGFQIQVIDKFTRQRFSPFPRFREETG